MKKLIVLILLAPLFCFGQELIENKVDDFTKNHVKRTSYEIAVQNFKMNLFFRVSKINSTSWLDIKMMYTAGGAAKPVMIRQDDKIMLMFANDSVISLTNLKTTLSCRGCGARGFSGSGAEGIAISYIIDDPLVQLLQNNAIKKVRIYTSDGYIEDEIKEKRGDVLKQLLALVQ